MTTQVIREEHYEAEPPHRRLLGVLARVFDLAFGLLYTLLLVRFALVFFGARPGPGFYQLVRDASEPFYRPFEGLFATSSFEAWHVEWPILVAVIAYMLLHGAVRGVISLIDR